MTPSSHIRQSASPFRATEVFLRDEAYAPHRHSDFTLAMTCAGVQSFNYRGELHHSLPGQVVVLRPDELHDGRAGTESGFRYRAVSLDPELFHAVGAGHRLPELQDGVANSPALFQAVQTLCAELDRELDDLERDDALECVVTLLRGLAGQAQEPSRSPDINAAKMARAYLDEMFTEPVDLETLADVVGKDRWELSRAFKAVYGVSPYRYLIYRRLDDACRRLIHGDPLSDAAVACGFFDQSHLTRHFKTAYGLTPSRWLKLRQ